LKQIDFTCEVALPLNETRQILALEYDHLEELIKKWIVRLIENGDEYVGFDRPTASADQGRDSVGFLTEFRYDGAWDNYQAKQLKKPLSLGDFFSELGKVFYYASEERYTMPRRYIFVAPNSAEGPVLKLIDRPSTIGPALLKNWDTHCKTKIKKPEAPLTPEIRELINGFSFQNVELWKCSTIIEKPQMRGLMVEHLDLDPGAAPTVRESDIPSTPGDDEISYINQLLDVFASHRGSDFTDHEAAMADPDYGPKVIRARRQFLERKAFRLHFRDNLDAALLDQVDTDVFDGVYDHYCSHEKGELLKRLLGVMERAASVEVTGPLGKHRRVTPSVKQGTCHHYASKGKQLMRWDR
jgi:hypothetical protein